jgi:two-component system sensor histidine kinase BaeS
VALAETGSLPVNAEAVDLAVLANAVRDDFAGAAGAAGVAIAVEVDPAASQIEADPARLRQALANLVSNALRYSPPGGTVRIAATGDAERVTLTVTDTGPGIPPDLEPRVFERFVRSADSPGSGLGLAIVADIAAAHGGEVSARNDPAGGASVALSLPRRR